MPGALGQALQAGSSCLIHTSFRQQQPVSWPCPQPGVGGRVCFLGRSIIVSSNFSSTALKDFDIPKALFTREGDGEGRENISSFHTGI